MSQNSSENHYSKTTSEKEIQTVVRVFPFILKSDNSDTASILSDKKFCTIISLEASKDLSQTFYSQLQYCPYEEIQHDALRIVDLPREKKLKWMDNHNRFSLTSLRRLTLEDDDGVAQCFNDLLNRLRNGQNKMFVEVATQTDLVVRPYLLPDPRIATVYYSNGVQISLGCIKPD